MAAVPRDHCRLDTTARVRRKLLRVVVTLKVLGNVCRGIEKGFGKGYLLHATVTHRGVIFETMTSDGSQRANPLSYYLTSALCDSQNVDNVS